MPSQKRPPSGFHALHAASAQPSAGKLDHRGWAGAWIVAGSALWLACSPAPAPPAATDTSATAEALADPDDAVCSGTCDTLVADGTGPQDSAWPDQDASQVPDQTAKPDLPDSGELPDPNCHLDCFGGAHCAAGKVTTWHYGPIPCWTDIQQCPTKVLGTCALGCAKDTGGLPYWASALEVCQEGAIKPLGLPCQATADCMPSEVMLLASDATPLVASCDQLIHVCVAKAIQPADDFGKPCSNLSIGLQYSDGPGATHLTALCANGVCNHVACPGGSPCPDPTTNQQCTNRCRNDGDCPAGATCKQVQLSISKQIPPAIQVCVPNP